MIDKNTLTDTEQRVYDWAIEKGFQVFRNGWPDFAFRNRLGEVVLGEVKKENSSLNEEQKEMLSLLSMEGLKILIFRIQDEKIEIKDYYSDMLSIEDYGKTKELIRGGHLKSKVEKRMLLTVELRKKGMTYDEIAKKIGVNRRTLWRDKKFLDSISLESISKINS